MYTGHKDHYLSFLRELVVYLLTQHGTKQATARRSLSILTHPRDIRYPKYLHNYLITYLSNQIPTWLHIYRYDQTDLTKYLTTYRYDQTDHWITDTELKKHGKRTTRNCKMCLEMERDTKAVNMCTKCNAPLQGLPCAQCPLPDLDLGQVPFICMCASQM